MGNNWKLGAKGFVGVNMGVPGELERQMRVVILNEQM
jgi:hypothetical protein